MNLPPHARSHKYFFDVITTHKLTTEYMMCEMNQLAPLNLQTFGTTNRLAIKAGA